MRAEVTKKLILNAPLATALRPSRTSEKLMQMTLFNHVPEVDNGQDKEMKTKPRAYLFKVFGMQLGWWGTRTLMVLRLLRLVALQLTWTLSISC
eukprot:m.244858 g.244858  ORF g.244858 m.244858 type:complete len:94 (-) comp17467_c0_seq30:3755-4036(-)